MKVEPVFSEKVCVSTCSAGVGRFSPPLCVTVGQATDKQLLTPFRFSGTQSGTDAETLTAFGLNTDSAEQIA